MGCITMILVGFTSKIIYKEVNLSGILTDFRYYANLWVLTLSKYLEQPSVIQSRTVILEVTWRNEESLIYFLYSLIIEQIIISGECKD